MDHKGFKLSIGETLNVSAFTGEVLESNRTKHTSVHQGKATVGANYVVPGEVYSEVHTEHQVWSRDALGNEKAFDFADFDVPVRVGHRVSILYAGMQGNAALKLTMIKNHTTGTWAREPKLCSYLKADASKSGKQVLHVLGIPIGIGLVAVGIAALHIIQTLSALALFLGWTIRSRITFVHGALRR
jgi:hypothetical protein